MDFDPGVNVGHVKNEVTPLDMPKNDMPGKFDAFQVNVIAIFSNIDAFQVNITCTCLLTCLHKIDIFQTL